MESITTSRHHYKPYEASVPKRQYGELLSNVYLGPLEKFQGTTTTGDTYQGRTGYLVLIECIPKKKLRLI